MSILEKTRQFERHIAGKMSDVARSLVQRTSGAREPVELTHAILDAVEREIQAGVRGTRIFPFNTIDISIVAPSPADRARLEAIVDGDVRLRDRIGERLLAAGCRASDLTVHVNYVSRAQKNWTDPQFSVAFSRIAAQPVAAPNPDTAAAARIEIIVVRGAAERRTYVFTSHRIDLGRGAEVRDSHNTLIRTNHVAFIDASDPINGSISRQHAHLAYEQRTGELRVHDDGSVHGTKIVRVGKTLAVPWRGRGGRLQSGDEIELGEARLRVKFQL
jgi:hypothetical protein